MSKANAKIAMSIRASNKTIAALERMREACDRTAAGMRDEKTLEMFRQSGEDERTENEEPA